MYKRLGEYHKELIPLNEYISERWDLEKMGQNEMFLKRITDDYHEWKTEFEKYYSEFKKLEEDYRI